MYDFAIIGAGIIGLSVAMQLSETYPDKKIVVLEKENAVALHQTGRNSGVIHSGIYYRPNSMKAEFATSGNQHLIDFCHHEGIQYEQCGKVIAAIHEKELPSMERLYQRGIANGIPVQKIAKEEIHAYEPHLQAIAGIYVPTTGIVDYGNVASAYANKFQENQGEIVYGTKVEAISEHIDHHAIQTDAGFIHARYVVNCAGLYSDKIAESSGIKLDMKIIPFRGEYYWMREDKSYLVRNLVYPVPDPAFPFLGIHFTRMIDGGVTIGPNAIPGLKREAYRKLSMDFNEMMDTLGYRPFWQVALSNIGEGLKEMGKSFSKSSFLTNIKQYFPQVEKDDIVPAEAGVRAQALDTDGNLLDDFFIARTSRMIHVCNAPSPAATASLEIGKYIVEQIRENRSIAK